MAGVRLSWVGWGYRMEGLGIPKPTIFCQKQKLCCRASSMLAEE